MPPSKHLAVVACMDARLDVYRLLGLELGEAHVIRNAGGVVSEDVGIRPPFALEAFPDPDDDVRQSIVRLRASPFLVHKDRIRGFVYEVETGRLREVR